MSTPVLIAVVIAVAAVAAVGIYSWSYYANTNALGRAVDEYSSAAGSVVTWVEVVTVILLVGILGIVLVAVIALGKQLPALAGAVL